MTVAEILIEWLKAHGYDALVNDECGCGIDDLAPCCDGPCADCKAGHKVACKDCDLLDKVDADGEPLCVCPDGQGDGCYREGPQKPAIARNPGDRGNTPMSGKVCHDREFTGPCLEDDCQYRPWETCKHGKLFEEADHEGE